MIQNPWRIAQRFVKAALGLYLAEVPDGSGIVTGRSRSIIVKPDPQERIRAESRLLHSRVYQPQR
jgi:hypothetical protein